MFDLVIVHPMSSMSGYINYVQFTAGTNKGDVTQGTVFNDPFKLGDVDVNYTSSKVETNMTLTASTTAFTAAWTPIIPGSVKIVNGSDVYVDDGNGAIYKNPTSTSKRIVTTTEVDGVAAGTAPTFEVVITGGTAAGTIAYTGDNAGVTLTTGITGAAEFTYTYNNVAIPQNDLAVLNARIESMPLIAKARRVAIYFSQIAAFQA